MANLSGNDVALNYLGILNLQTLNSGVTGSFQYLQDGGGTNLPIQVKTGFINFTDAVTAGGSNILRADGSIPLTTGWNIGAFAITTTQIATTANTAYDGFVLSNTTTATTGNQQYSSSIHFIGQGFGGSTSQTVEIRNLLVPVQGGTNPSAQFTMDAKINGGSWANMMMLSTSGGLSIASGAASPSFIIGNSGSSTYQFYTTAFSCGGRLTAKGGGTAGNMNVNWGDSERAGIFGGDANGSAFTACGTNNIERWRTDWNGRTSMGGVFTATATLHLAAGVAAASGAPIKLTAGTLNTTPELGAIEYVDDGTTGHFYFTLKVATVTTRVAIL